MKVVTIMGSPKKNGKTATALEIFEKNIKAQGHEIDRINVTDYNVGGCLGCGACMRHHGEIYCTQKDDAPQLLERIASADAVVYASPIYCWELSGQIKPLIDRHYAFLSTDFLNRKPVALLVTCGGGASGNADLAQGAFKRMFDGSHGGILRSKLIGEYAVPSSDAPNFKDRAAKVAETMARDVLRTV